MAAGLQSPLGQNSMQLRSIPSSSTPYRPAASTNNREPGFGRKAADALLDEVPYLGVARGTYRAGKEALKGHIKDAGAYLASL